MSKPTKEYYKAKAELCQKTAIKQILEGNSGEGAKNLIRMMNAMSEINAIDYKRERANETNEVL
jgi:hypothetical protein